MVSLTLKKQTLDGKYVNLASLHKSSFSLPNSEGLTVQLLALRNNRLERAQLNRRGIDQSF